MSETNDAELHVAATPLSIAGKSSSPFQSGVFPHQSPAAPAAVPPTAAAGAFPVASTTFQSSRDNPIASSSPGVHQQPQPQPPSSSIVPASQLQHSQFSTTTTSAAAAVPSQQQQQVPNNTSSLMSMMMSQKSNSVQQQQQTTLLPPSFALTKPPNGGPPGSTSMLQQMSSASHSFEQPSHSPAQPALTSALSSLAASRFRPAEPDATEPDNRRFGGGGGALGALMGGGVSPAAHTQNKSSVGNFNCDITVESASSAVAAAAAQRPSSRSVGGATGGGRYSSLDRAGGGAAAPPPPSQQQQQPHVAHPTQDSYYGDIVPPGARGGRGAGDRGRGGPQQQQGYNFQQIMDDHFEHYRRPPSRPASREASVDRMPTALAEAAAAGAHRRGPVPTSGLPGSRPPSRPGSRNRAPMLQRSGQAADDFNVASSSSSTGHRQPAAAAAAAASSTANGDFPSSSLRHRGGVQPSQEIPNLGTVPKRTESLYMKYGAEANRVSSTASMQVARKPKRLVIWSGSERRRRRRRRRQQPVAQEEPAGRAEPGLGDGGAGLARDDARGDQRAVQLAARQRPPADGGDREIQAQPPHVHNHPEGSGERKKL